jgi:hypothetical protein
MTAAIAIKGLRKSARSSRPRARRRLYVALHDGIVTLGGVVEVRQTLTAHLDDSGMVVVLRPPS